MNRTLYWIAGVILALSITACGKSDEPAKPATPKETVFDDLIANKERAKQQTEQAMQQRKEQLDEALKKSEAGSSAE